MSCLWIVTINASLVIFYFVKIILAVFKLFRKIREYHLENNQNLEAVHINTSTTIGMYI